MTSTQTPVFSKGDKVCTDTGVTGTVDFTYMKGDEPMVKIRSASYIRGSQSIKASRLHHLNEH